MEGFTWVCVCSYTAHGDRVARFCLQRPALAWIAEQGVWDHSLTSRCCKVNKIKRNNPHMGISVFFLSLFLFCFTQAGRSVLNRDNLLKAHWNHNTSLHFATFFAVLVSQECCGLAPMEIFVLCYGTSVCKTSSLFISSLKWKIPRFGSMLEFPVPDASAFSPRNRHLAVIRWGKTHQEKKKKERTKSVLQVKRSKKIYIFKT